MRPGNKRWPQMLSRRRRTIRSSPVPGHRLARQPRSHRSRLPWRRSRLVTAAPGSTVLAPSQAAGQPGLRMLRWSVRVPLVRFSWVRVRTTGAAPGTFERPSIQRPTGHRWRRRPRACQRRTSTRRPLDTANHPRDTAMHPKRVQVEPAGRPVTAPTSTQRAAVPSFSKRARDRSLTDSLAARGKSCRDDALGRGGSRTDDGVQPRRP